MHEREGQPDSGRLASGCGMWGYWASRSAQPQDKGLVDSTAAQPSWWFSE